MSCWEGWGTREEAGPGESAAGMGRGSHKVVVTAVHSGGQDVSPLELCEGLALTLTSITGPMVEIQWICAGKGY